MMASATYHDGQQDQDIHAAIARWAALVDQALTRAATAVREWRIEPVQPVAPPGRPRTWVLARWQGLALHVSVYLPESRSPNIAVLGLRLYQEGGESERAEMLTRRDVYPEPHRNDGAARWLVYEVAGGRPRRILHLLRGLEQIEAWAQARLEGRRRHAREVWQAQAEAAMALDARAALAALASP